ncbi:hypothetical protein BG006_008692 [Podila minutissima]|uniref:Senescence domain-containing protein n=1 Tax=Podila minutissima TaxID=64525 RepID=A0A9P5SUD3_9FUNG|nr:hypothetical protein BG006_008692 [Podila minutissima]
MAERTPSPSSTPPPSYLPTAADVDAGSSSADTAPPATASNVPDQKQALISTILSIPNAAISQVQSATSDKKLIGTGELRVYSSAPLEVAANVPATTFMTLETNDTPTRSYTSLITHPLMPTSTAQKTGDDTWQFSVVGNGFLELRVTQASQSDVAALENLLADRVVYTNRYSLRNQLALVDDVGQIYGVLDKDEVEMEDDDSINLPQNAKAPVVVREVGSSDETGDKPIRFKVSVPKVDDMADYLTSASQYFGESMIKGATAVAGGITTSSTYLNSKIPETQKPLKISPFIKKRIRNLTLVSRATFSVTSRFKKAVVTGVLSTGYKVIKYWTANDDPEKYSSMQNFAYAVLNSIGVLIQAAEESFGIVSTPAISASQDLTGRALGPDAKEILSDALEGLKNFTLVYFDNAGISRRAFLQTSRMAALQTTQEVRDGKIRMKERKKEAEEATSVPLSAKASEMKNLIFRYFGRSEEDHAKGEPSSPSKRAPTPSAEGSSSIDKKKKTE